jgi:hypothetical protein
MQRRPNSLRKAFRQGKGETTMRFMMMVKAAENSGPPPKEMVDAIEKLSEEGQKSGKIVVAGGLAPTVASTRVRSSHGSLTVTDGPFAETKEVVGGYAIMNFASKEEAVESALQMMELHRKFWPAWEGETEIRQTFGTEDFTYEGGSSQLKSDGGGKK